MPKNIRTVELRRQLNLSSTFYMTPSYLCSREVALATELGGACAVPTRKVSHEIAPAYLEIMDSLSKGLGNMQFRIFIPSTISISGRSCYTAYELLLIS